MWKQWSLTLWLILSILSLPCGAVEMVPKGFTTDSPGYLLTLDEGREVAIALQQRRLERNEWKAAYFDMKNEFTETTEQFNSRLDKLEVDIANERKAWKAEANKSRITAGTIGVIIGLLGGVLAR